MIDSLKASMITAASAIEAQSTRLRVASENLANAQSTGNTPGSDPYARKTVSFSSQLDEVTGVNKLIVGSISADDAPFRVESNPSHPAADENGNVKLPNVNVLMEMADMRETNRSYEANLQVVKQARELVSMTIDLLRSR
ncbi:MAG: flagellar basal body rod protein FlgC [Hyphomicrobiaceae bacterium]